MSTPINPLSGYSSYSYHHILIACDSSTGAEQLSKSDNLMDFVRKNQNEGDEKYTPRDVIPGKPESGKYIIIANGMTDAEFIISKLQWFSTTASNVNTSQGGDFFTAMATDGTMEVQEPRGIRFFNVLNTVCDKLQTDPSGIVWMVKTVFVGHSHNRQTGNFDNHITNIRPLLFMIYDITAQFDVTGGIYQISFVGLNNGAAKSPQVIKATESVKINLGKTKTTISAAFEAMQAVIQKQYEKHYTEVTEKLKKEYPTYKGRKVLYEIVLDEIYKDAKYKVTDSLTPNKDGRDPDYGIVMDFSRGVTIENAIRSVMGRCQQVRDDLKGGKDKQRFNYKIISTIVSNDKEFKVVYRVSRFLEPQSDIIERVQSGSSDADIKKNTVEYDYFFSGKNIDILEFDIKMEMGLAFFQTLTSTSNLGSTKQEPQKASNSEVQQKPRTDKKPIREKTPIYFGTKVKNPIIRNSQDPASSAEFQALLRRHAALEALEAKMKIVGNPSLMGAMNKLPSQIYADRVWGRSSSEADAAFPHWETIPALAKVNIYMPTNKTDRDFSEKFWYDGYYYVYGITNEFNEGEFTQTLDMLSLPDKALFDQQQKELEEQKKKETACSAIEGTLKVTGLDKVTTTENVRTTVGQIETQITYNTLEHCKKKT